MATIPARSVRTAALTALLAPVLSGTALAHTGQGVTHHHHGPMGGGGWMMGAGGWGWLWMLLWLLVLIALVAGGAILLARAGGSGVEDDGEDDALAVLRERYARGDIDDEEFEKRRAKLRESE